MTDRPLLNKSSRTGSDDQITYKQTCQRDKSGITKKKAWGLNGTNRSSYCRKPVYTMIINKDTNPTGYISYTRSTKSIKKGVIIKQLYILMARCIQRLLNATRHITIGLKARTTHIYKYQVEIKKNV